MPKLSEAVIKNKKDAIETAAKDLFIKQGFHATSMRDIAKEAEASLGNLYNYYETKEAIFESIVNAYLIKIDARLKDIFEQIEEPLDPLELRKLGKLAGELVNEHHDFWLLMYIDVLEFRNQHFSKIFSRLSERFSRVFGEKFEKAKKRGDTRAGIEPSVAFTAAYMQFFNYFLVEKLFGGDSHLGLDDEQALNALTKIFSYGVLSDKKMSEFKKNFSANG